MHILILQHAWVEAPGVLEQALERDGHTCSYVHLDKEEVSPPLDDVDALWVLGGPMDTSDEEAEPWLVREKRVIRAAVVEHGLPFLGICLGHQLLADALGGSCDAAAEPEIGIFPVTVNAAGTRSAWFDALGPSPLQVLENHTTHIVRPPPECTVLAHSERCAVQAMQRGSRVVSVQFHLETPPERAVGWLSDESLRSRLLASPGLAGKADPESILRRHVERGNQRAGAFYDEWLKRASALD